MEVMNNNVSPNKLRKLLVGERVEVRQRERGLRGSWHSGKVTRVKSGRRVVEYDELFTKDGSAKLKECISLYDEIRSETSGRRSTPPLKGDKSGFSDKRGFIRPIPPSCLIPPRRDWRRGLLVDAFYNDAWWEGILLQDVFSSECEESKAKIFFPDEGDELEVLLKDIRVSQEWDEVWGAWAVRGYWFFRGKVDLTPLKKICMRIPCPSRALWRQKRFCSPEDFLKQEERIKNQHEPVKPVQLQMRKTSPEDISLVAFTCEQPTAWMNNHCQEGASIKEEEKHTIVEDETSISAEAAGNSTKVDRGRYTDCTTNSISKESESDVSHISILDGSTVDASKDQFSVQVLVGKKIKKRKISLCRDFEYEGEVRPRIARSTFDLENGTRSPVVKNKRNITDAYMITGALRFPVREKVIKYHNKRSTHVPELIDSECSSATLQENDSNLSAEFHEEMTNKKKKSTSLTKNSHKRKCEVNLEMKCKRGRLPIKANKHLRENCVQGSCRMQVLMAFPGRGTRPNASQVIEELSQFKKSSVLSWLIDKAILKENEPVSYVNRKNGRIMKTGKVTQEGVQCDCCKDVFTLSNFEAHAGSKLHRPSANMFLDDGRSISDCQLEACTVSDMKETEGIMDLSDDICGVCKDGGELILCDHCPATFHVDCIGLEGIPEGDWYCPKCRCGVCGNNQLTDEIDSRMVQCNQCELEYHLSCVPACPMPPLEQADSTIWFCDKKCQQIFVDLRRLVGRVHHMENGFSWVLLRSMKNEHGLSQTDLEVMAEHHSKLSVAQGVMQECFMPMIDPPTKINLISQVLYNRRSKVSRLNYGGFYTLLLEREDELICVATIRVHGAKFAEMPLIGTQFQYRRQGMCRRVMNVLEEMLKSLGVEKLILPSVPELQDTWIDGFGFQKMNLLDSQELSKLSLVTFPGTSLLQKCLLNMIPDCDPVDQPHTCNKVDNSQIQLHRSVEESPSRVLHSSDNDSQQGIMNEDISPMNSGMFNYMQEAISDDLCIPISSNTKKQKNQIRCKAKVGSDDDEAVVGKCSDDDLYTRVVVGTTRSKRLIKSTRWVADGLRKLKDSKQSRRNPHIEGNSTKRSASQSVKSCTNLSTPGANAENTGIGHTNTSNESIHLWFNNTAVMDEIQFCPKFYTRRQKGDHMQDYSKEDSKSVPEMSSILPNGGTQELISSSVSSGHLGSLTGRFTDRKGNEDGNMDVQSDEFSVTTGSAGMPNDAFDEAGSVMRMQYNDFNVSDSNLEMLAKDYAVIGGNADKGADDLKFVDGNPTPVDGANGIHSI